MNQLTSEERAFVDSCRTVIVKGIWPSDLIKLVQLIDRLSARCESFSDIEKREMILMDSVVELEKEKDFYKKEAERLSRNGQIASKCLRKQSSNLSSLLEAVEPIEKAIKNCTLVDEQGICDESLICCNGLEDIKAGELRTLSTIAAGIKGGKG